MGRSATGVHRWIWFFLCCWTSTSAQSVSHLFPKTTDEVPPIPKDITVGAYYYPWHGDDFHRGDGYVRNNLKPRHQPTLGEYNDALPTTVGQHLAWSRKANINLWLASWWGPGFREDVTISEVILKHVDLGDHQIALMYESLSRVRKGDGWTTQRVAPDMKYICQTYFENNNYYKIDGKPVLAMYLTRVLHNNGVLGRVTKIMRDTARDVCDTEIYIIGDQVWGNAPHPREDYPPFDYLDAVTNYDLYGNTNHPPYATQGTVDRYYTEQGRWRDRAKANNANYIPAVSPGYNDRGVRLEADHMGLSRRLTEDSEPGTLFAAQLQQAPYLVDSGAGNLLLVNSFNEWHEDSQIEPCVGEPTTEPFEYTNGIMYEGYGELYLDILRAGTTCGTNCQRALFVHPGRPPKEAYPLGLCVGHCDTDDQCAEGLYCFKRDPNTGVPGCSGGEEDNSRTDYCATRGTGELFVHPGRPARNAYPLGDCVGHCNTDDECAEGLSCFKRDPNTAVPGCNGGEEDNSRTDYCARIIAKPEKPPTSGTLFVHPGRPPNNAYPLGECVGHCNFDENCAEGLHCFKRNPNTAVPGCNGGEEDNSRTDYCARIPTSGTLFVHPGRPPKNAYPLGQCVGHCKKDKHCAEGLYCFQRARNTAVPGCIGGEEDNSRTDYCTSIVHDEL
jgi:glycoprotein endo-alpha-1,2-mannosidase